MSYRRPHRQGPARLAPSKRNGVTPRTASPTMIHDLLSFPEPMEIAFSLDAGSFSRDLLFTQPALPMGVNPLHVSQPPPLANAIVICFENVLVPVKWMAQHLGLRATPRAVETARAAAVQNPYAIEALASLEQFVMQFLTTLSAHGPVCILSEESASFVEKVCELFFPRLAYCLANPQVLPGVQVMGAPRKFTTSAEKTAWRIQLMQSLVRDRLFAATPQLLLQYETGRFGFLVASPHPIDSVACGKICEVAPFAIPKSVKVANVQHLTLEQFTSQLLALNQYLLECVPHPTSFAVSL